jgi:hypothetical protein
MHVTLEVPEDLVRHFAGDANGVSRAALEALALEGLRSGKLTTSQARRLSGIQSRYEIDGFLKAHEFFLTTTIEDVRRDTQTAIGVHQMRVVVADTSPLNYLVLIDSVDILPQLFGRVIVPVEVVAELEMSGCWR